MNEIVPAIIGLLGVAIGAVVSYYAQVRVLEKSNQRQQKTLAITIAAEIEAFFQLVKRRQSIDYAEAALVEFEAGRDMEFPRLLIAHETSLGEFPIFRSVMTRLGELGPLAGDVACFYSLVDGLRSNSLAAERGVLDNLPPIQKAAGVRQELASWRDLQQLGHRLIRELKVLATN